MDCRNDPRRERIFQGAGRSRRTLAQGVEIDPGAARRDVGNLPADGGLLRGRASPHPGVDVAAAFPCAQGADRCAAGERNQGEGETWPHAKMAAANRSNCATA